MVRSALITLGLLLTLAVPASAQELGTPLVVSTAHIKHEGARVGALTVSRDGASIVATAAFKGRPPGKTMSVCVTVAGEERCATRKARRNGTVTLETSADFTAPLSAKARSGAARGHLAL
jgi:hypothetical protein